MSALARSTSSSGSTCANTVRIWSWVATRFAPCRENLSRAVWAIDRGPADVPDTHGRRGARYSQSASRPRPAGPRAGLLGGRSGSRAPGRRAKPSGRTSRRSIARRMGWSREYPAGTRDIAMSDWSKVTRPIPVPNEWTKPFWEAAQQGVLALQRCQACGHFQHPPYRDVRELHGDRSQVRARERQGHDLRLHDHVPRRRQAIRRGRPVREHHRGARRRPGGAAGRQSARCAVHRGEGGASRGGDLRAAERRHHPAAVPAGAPARP